MTRRAVAVITERELVEAGYEITGGSVRSLTDAKLRRLMTVTQFVSDCCLNEIERRGLLEWHEGVPCVPYDSDHVVHTVLTREPGDKGS